jgi:hypothetical protein
MKTVIWIACGIGLNIAAAALHGGSAPEAIMTSGVAGTLPKLLLVATGNICIWRGLRSAIRDLWGAASGKSQRRPEARRFADEPEPASDFDADEAFERYMQQRKAREAEPTEPATGPPPRSCPQVHASAPAPVRGGFGRKVV